MVTIIMRYGNGCHKYGYSYHTCAWHVHGIARVSSDSKLYCVLAAISGNVNGKGHRQLSCGMVTVVTNTGMMCIGHTWHSSC